MARMNKWFSIGVISSLHSELLGSSTSKGDEGKGEPSELVESPTHGWTHDHPDAEEGLQDGEHGGHVGRELLGDHAEAAGQEAGVAAGFNYSEVKIGNVLSGMKQWPILQTLYDRNLQFYSRANSNFLVNTVLELHITVVERL